MEFTYQEQVDIHIMFGAFDNCVEARRFPKAFPNRFELVTSRLVSGDLATSTLSTTGCTLDQQGRV